MHHHIGQRPDAPGGQTGISIRHHPVIRVCNGLAVARH
jgi:hypothetical protein